MSFRRKMERDHQRRDGYAPIVGGDSSGARGFGGPKLSAVLLELIGPHLDRAESDADVERLVALGAIAWNAALLPADERDAMVHAAASATIAEERAEFVRTLDAMIARKLRYFAGDQRMIAEYDVSMTPDGPHVVVAWAARRS